MTVVVMAGAALGYAFVVGVVYAALRRLIDLPALGPLEEAEFVLAWFWPVTVLVGACIGLVWLSWIIAGRVGAAAMDVAVGIISGRRLPRAKARQSGGRP